MASGEESMAKSRIDLAAFRRVIWSRYRKEGRHDLPWRKTHDPYRILVSEVMLQQTQVERVIPFYTAVIKKFPTASKLAAAPLSSVLTAWQGLGYNRRAKMLWEASKEMRGKKRFSIEELEALPGVGPYTARAVAAFAYNEDAIFVETNIRTVVIHHFFPKKKIVHDRDIEKILAAALPAGKAREWYSALMDYGSHLKRSGISHNAKSRAYIRQSAFKGSMREARGVIVRSLTKGPATAASLMRLLGPGRKTQMRQALRTLRSEGLLELRAGRFSLPDADAGAGGGRSRG